MEEPFWKQKLSVKEKPSEYFRRSARVKKGRRSIACFEDARTGSTRSFCSRCGPALLYERKRSPHMVNIPRARSSPAVPAASSATTWPSRSFRIGPTPANGLSPSRAIQISSENSRNSGNARVTVDHPELFNRRIRSARAQIVQ